jgi:hypothetical protein
VLSGENRWFNHSDSSAHWGAGSFSVITDLHLRNYDHVLSQERGHRTEIGNALDVQEEINLKNQDDPNVAIDERDEVRSQSKLLATELSHALASVQSLKDESRQIYGSRSWKYLKPLRRLRRLFKRPEVQRFNEDTGRLKPK